MKLKFSIQEQVAYNIKKMQFSIHKNACEKILIFAKHLQKEKMAKKIFTLNYVAFTKTMCKKYDLKNFSFDNISNLLMTDRKWFSS